MTFRLKFLAAALALACGSASAVPTYTITTSSGPFTEKGGVCTVDFNTPGSVSSCAGSSYSAAGGIASHIVTGSLAGVYAQPTGDATPYLTLGPSAGSPVMISIGGAGANYFGFYAGSIDTYNSITFSGPGFTTLTLTGADFAGVADATANGSKSAYFNIFTTGALFNTITLASSANAFETDNHSFGIASPVPEPASVALLGLGALALAAGRRRRSRQ